MGQTLTHGVYLPDEGERNCYNGLAANWQLLDGAVGTVAEHTSALAGKAPLVHTHTKSDITDFPAYGTTAGTICEGNDSRLSDARTPVAHTHTKSDVTDLFNSANTWSAVNQYSREIQLAGDRNAYIAPMWSGVGSGIAFLSMDAGKQFVFGQRTTDANNRSVYDATKGYLVLKTGVIGESNYVEVTPHGSDTRLGDSTNKWKSLNGINPGALSLLNSAASDNINITNWDKRATNGVIGSVTASVDGWINVQIQRDGDFSVWVIGSYRQLFRSSPISGSYGNRGLLILMFPIEKNKSVTLYTPELDPLESDLTFGVYKFFPCLGNV